MNSQLKTTPASLSMTPSARLSLACSEGVVVDHKAQPLTVVNEVLATLEATLEDLNHILCTLPSKSHLDNRIAKLQRWIALLEEER